MIKLYVENFRIIKSAELMINKGINVLYGSNGDGKSSLIYALLSMLGIKDEDLGNMLRPEDNAVSRPPSLSLMIPVEIRRGIL